MRGVSFFDGVSSEDSVSHTHCGFFEVSPVVLSVKGSVQEAAALLSLPDTPHSVSQTYQHIPHEARPVGTRMLTVSHHCFHLPVTQLSVQSDI